MTLNPPSKNIKRKNLLNASHLVVIFFCLLGLMFILTPVVFHFQFKYMARNSASIQCWKQMTPFYVDGFTDVGVPRSDDQVLEHAKCLGVEANSAKHAELLSEGDQIEGRYLQGVYRIPAWLRLLVLPGLG